MPTPSQTIETTKERVGPNPQTMSALASRVGPLIIGSGVVAAGRALPFSLDELARLEKTWRFDAA